MLPFTYATKNPRKTFGSAILNRVSCVVIVACNRPLVYTRRKQFLQQKTVCREANKPKLLYLCEYCKICLIALHVCDSTQPVGLYPSQCNATDCVFLGFGNVPFRQRTFRFVLGVLMSAAPLSEYSIYLCRVFVNDLSHIIGFSTFVAFGNKFCQLNATSML